MTKRIRSTAAGVAAWVCLAGTVVGQQTAARPDDEFARIVEALALQPGMSAADVGIGEGLQALALAEYLQPAGRVYATDVNETFLSNLRDAAATKALRNVTTILGDPNHTNLPDLCCDAMLIRNVYHHFGDPPAMNASLLRGLKPGGRLLVIDFEPDNRRPYPPSQRASGPGHGVAASVVAEELKAAGFQVLRIVDQWSGRMTFAVTAAKPE